MSLFESTGTRSGFSCEFEFNRVARQQALNVMYEDGVGAGVGAGVGQ
jgi:hypothetical protein